MTSRPSNSVSIRSIVPPQTIEVTTRWLAQYEASSRALDGYLSEIAEQVRKATESIIPLDLTKLGLSAAFQQQKEEVARWAQEMSARYMPPAWEDLTSDEWWAAIDLASTGVLCCVWGPPVEVLRELLNANDDQQRDEVLVRHRERIIEDVQLQLQAVDAFASDDHEHAHALALEASNVAAAGHDVAAQTVAAVALGPIIHRALGIDEFAEARRKMHARDPEETGMSEIRKVLIFKGTVVALTKTKDHQHGFNRHGTLHGDPAFFDTASMLSGLLLMLAWVRELETYVDE